MRKLIIVALFVIGLNSNSFAGNAAGQTWADQMKAEIDQSYKNKEITKYEHLDLLIKLKQYMGGGQVQGSMPEKSDDRNLSGEWSTSWGDMTISQKGNTFNAFYSYLKGKINGTIDNKGVVTGVWSQSPTYQPPKDQGKVRFSFDNNSFTGCWGFGSDEPLKCDWHGMRK